MPSGRRARGARAGTGCAYIDYVAEHAEGFCALRESGIGADPEVRAILEQATERQAKRLLEGITVGAEPPDALRVAVRGWLGFIESASLQWLAEGRRVPKEQLRDLFVQALITAALTAWPQDQRPKEARIEVPPR